MDYSEMNDFIDTRECNFLSNSKSWANGEDLNGWPFETTAITALILDDKSGNSTIYSKVTDGSQVVSDNAWHVDALAEHNKLDAFVASLLSTDDTHSVELLLVNPQLLIKNGFIDRLADRHRRYNDGRLRDEYVGKFEQEVFAIYDILGWCWDEAKRHTASKTSASHSCYAKGRKARR
jgi:hypothetical protein